MDEHSFKSGELIRTRVDVNGCSISVVRLSTSPFSEPVCKVGLEARSGIHIVGCFRMEMKGGLGSWSPWTASS